MRKEEVLLAEHRELVELYRHQWTTIFYFGISYLILNGAIASVIGFTLPLEQTTSINLGSLVAFLIAIVGNIVFFFIMHRMQVQLLSLVNRAVAIENIFQEKKLQLDTFGILTVSIRKGKTLMDSQGSYAELKPWQKIGVFDAMCTFALVVGFSWIILLVVYLTLFLR